MNALQQYDLDRFSGVERLLGVDEAGRGCLAGPVVAGACVITREFFESEAAISLSAAINDSKQLKAIDREAQYGVLLQLQAMGLIDFAVGEGSVREIMDLNILGATRLAMQRALESLVARASGWELPLDAESGPLFETESQIQILVDGRPLAPFPYAHAGVVQGDGKSLSIAMASIAAKVSRDRRMRDLDACYPDYGFAKHKGYGTAAHRLALNTHGACSEHRELFLRKVLRFE